MKNIKRYEEFINERRKELWSQYKDFKWDHKLKSLKMPIKEFLKDALKREVYSDMKDSAPIKFLDGSKTLNLLFDKEPKGIKSVAYNGGYWLVMIKK